MAFPPEERRALLATPLVGKKTLAYLEAIGLDSFALLSEQEADFVCGLIAHHSGLSGWATHSMAIQCIRNAISTARHYSDANPLSVSFRGER